MILLDVENANLKRKLISNSITNSSIASIELRQKQVQVESVGLQDNSITVNANIANALNVGSGLAGNHLSL